jgi:XTP/dITP diphosphohydrolase
MKEISQRNPEAAFGRLLKIMDDLRSGCPWDREQTMESLRKLTIEETYELGDAILQNDLRDVRNELGDLMLHIIFYAKIGSEQGAFDIYDVLETISNKLIHRHPHIYGAVQVRNSDDVKQNWESLKLKEGRKGVLAGVPDSLPALIKANRIQEKVHGIGFDWKDKNEIWEKIQEEINELSRAMQNEQDNDNHADIEEEFGDLIFSIINAARLYGIEPENALERTNLKFIRRFNAMETSAEKTGKPLRELSLEEMDRLWEAAKARE